MGAAEAVIVIASLVAVLGGVAGIFAALVGHLLEED